MTKKKLDLAIEGLDEIKRKQVLAELKTVKLQYRLAILGIVGSAIAFLVIQQNNIKSIFKKDPHIIYSSNEAFVQDKALVAIADSKGELIAKTDLKNIGKGIEVKPGSYTAVIRVDSLQLWYESFVIGASETRRILLPDFYTNTVRVMVKNNSPRIAPSQAINVEISASGNGYLWIYELLNKKECKLLFPEDTAGNKHSIQSGENFLFPDDLSLYSGKDAKQEKYIFLVTSLNDKSFAENVMEMLYAKTITKGEIKGVEQNWGVQEITVDVVK